MEFNHYEINGPNGPEPMGSALYNSKFYVHSNFGWDHVYEFQNMFDYNLYGDPAMFRVGLNNGSPLKPTISGPLSGKTGVEYDYIFRSVDPTDEEIYYHVIWGETDIPDKYGPYSSGEEVIIKHKWNESGSYKVEVRAVDPNNEESDSAELIVTMPRYKLSYSRLINLLKMII